MNYKQAAQQLGWLFTALSLVTVGCGKGSEPVPTQPAKSSLAASGTVGEEPAGALPASSRTPEEDTLGKHQFRHKGGMINRPLTAALPRKACYTGLCFTVTKGTISDVPPPAKQRRADAGHIYAYLDVTLQNQTESRTYSGISPDLFKLQ